MRSSLTASRRTLAAALIAAVTLTGVPAITGLTASPALAVDPQARIEQVAAEIDALEIQSGAAHDRVDEAEFKLVGVTKQVAAAQRKVDAAKLRIGQTRGSIGALAAASYRSGGLDPNLALLFSENPDEFLTQASSVDQVAANQQTVLRRAKTDQLALVQASAALTAAQAQAKALRDDVVANKAEIDKNLAKEKTILAGLKEAERARLAELRRQQAIAAAKAAAEARRLAAIAAREAAAAAQRKADAAAAKRKAAAAAAAAAAAEAERKRKEKASQEAGNRPNPTPTPSDEPASSPEPSQQPSLGPTEDDSSNPAPAPSDSSDGGGDGGGGWSGDRAMTAVNYALAQVGKPYSYSANPPRSWDCSKLTAAAWARAGVSLTAYSYAQAGQVRRVSKNNLKPGDILFYFNGARHVAMYIGNGMLVEAASPRLGVRVAPLWNSWSARHYSYAGRPVG